MKAYIEVEKPIFWRIDNQNPTAISEVIEFLKIMFNRSYGSKITPPLGETRVSLDRSPRNLPNYIIIFKIVYWYKKIQKCYWIFEKKIYKKVDIPK